ncbi:MAG: diaminopimelate decarboxylase [Bacteroidales bacterium]|jgi:diaminopimelate decarboxylase|nr:diaminopimelate decarboxylase [Bacteroidales bacterium]MDD2813316.1 diaminopimelate decarboxylase [Bacteroidales bacterium]MDD3386055.1 diaminopimelate decarboxylase [Bacteroidales bacterium]MDD3812300.1 diaminopimelate decarboxylase [Bacteroidales bacterium]MDD3871910.1 diaminopimelate decarboxylase [Bacteroidales bacterium]
MDYKTHFPLDRFQKLETPFYYYDLELLTRTLDAVAQKANSYGYRIHYALKANANGRILKLMVDRNFGADCVSGYEIKRALESGFPSEGIVFAGVGKADWEIQLGLEADIASFNCESVQELRVINQIAREMGKKAPISLRINPHIDARTHHYITTGIEENKFGINPWEWEAVVETLGETENLEFKGLHFHIGSQITDKEVFKGLCARINEIVQWFTHRQLTPVIINAGGGLGIDYADPDGPIPDFEAYFDIFRRHLDLRGGQELHFEPGRALVAQCGTLISKVLYIKDGVNTQFAILDAGMTELIRPALYQAYHSIQNLTSSLPPRKYDIVGPICESSDCFGKAVELPGTQRGDLIAIRTAGAYGETMSSGYNLREKVNTWYSDEI